MSSHHVLGTAESAPYWDAAARNDLVYQHCMACETPQFPPRSHCAACGSAEPAWRDASGQGVIESFTTVHRAPNDIFRAQVPYVIALVRLAEGIRLMVNLRTHGTAPVHVGQPVKIVFETRPDGVVLPQAEAV